MDTTFASQMAHMAAVPGIVTSSHKTKGVSGRWLVRTYRTSIRKKVVEQTESCRPRNQLLCGRWEPPSKLKAWLMVKPISL